MFLLLSSVFSLGRTMLLTPICRESRSPPEIEREQVQLFCLPPKGFNPKEATSSNSGNALLLLTPCRKCPASREQTAGGVAAIAFNVPGARALMGEADDIGADRLLPAGCHSPRILARKEPQENPQVGNTPSHNPETTLPEVDPPFEKNGCNSKLILDVSWRQINMVVSLSKPTPGRKRPSSTRDISCALQTGTS